MKKFLIIVGKKRKMNKSEKNREIFYKKNQRCLIKRIIFR